MHLRPRKKLAAQLKTVFRPVTMRVFYHTLVTKRPNYQYKIRTFIDDWTGINGTTGSGKDFDNGAEFQGHFQQHLDEYGITHWWMYPRSPKVNAHAERFTRTLQEQVVDDDEDVRFDDVADFNRRLAD